jgi:hypothetical protein
MKYDIITVIVDTLNILYQSASGKPRVQTFQLVKQAITARLPGATIFFLADASTRHKIDDKDTYEKICKTEGIIQTPAGEQADDYLIAYAEKKPFCLIISCDRFRDHTIGEGLFRRIIPAVIIGEDVIFSKKLDNVLQSFEKKMAIQPLRVQSAVV